MIERRGQLATTDARDLALACIETGLEASDPERVLADAVTRDGETLRVGDRSYSLEAYDEVVVVGGGKASGRQARALERILGDRIDRGLVVTEDALDLERVEVRVGDHPVPSERGVAATRALLSLLEEADDGTLVIALITGGGSALVPAPAEGISLDDLQSVTESLLASGASIHEINAVRKHLSAIKGGGLARTAAPGRVLGLLMSDVVGNDLSVIASGPTAPDESSFADAANVLERYGIDPPASVADRIAAGQRGEVPETPDPGDPVFDRVDNHLTADGTTPIEAAQSFLEIHPHEPLFLSSRIRGEAREAAITGVAVGEEIRASGNPVAPPAVVLSGGETTVTLGGDGRGGPNQEFALSAAIEMTEPMTVAAVYTDGTDGTGPAAGAIVDEDTVGDVEAARDALDANDTYPYLRERNAIVETGPTGTNVNDFRVIVLEE